MIRVAVVEDNTDLREEVLFQLRHAGREAIGVGDGAALDALLREQDIDIVVLDLGLPGEDGMAIASRLRRDSGMDLGIVMLTARGALDDRVEGLETGADAYLVKPVEMRELLAVIGSVERRLAASAAAPFSSSTWKLDTVRRELVSIGGKSVTLTDTEFRLVERLVQVSPAVASRRELAEAMGESDFLQFDERRLEAAISRLRRKLQEETGEAPLRSARGRGYVFAAQVRMNGAG